MEIIVADANIFVYLHLCDLLKKFLSNNKYRVTVASAVYFEITDKNKRISREYPELRKLILDSNNNHSSPTTLDHVLTNQGINNIFAMHIYYDLNDKGELDLGEIESIPLSIELNARFLSNDIEAIKVANTMQAGLGIVFLEFCIELFNHGIIFQEELESIQELLNNY